MKFLEVKVRPQVVLLLILLCAAVWGVLSSINRPFFVNIDQGDIALVARNLVHGRGYTTDVIWLWDKDWGSPRHPESIWPLLQPTLTALSFLVFGDNVIASHLIIKILFLCMLTTTYIVGKRLFGPWEGVAATAILFTAPMMINMTNFGTNDMGAAFFYLASAYTIYKSFDKDASAGWVVAAAVFTGLSILQKFQGVVFVIAYGFWQLGALRSAPRRVIKRSALFLAVLTLMGLPMMIRNYMIFGQITYPSSKLVNALAANWDPLYERWRQQLLYYALYWEHPIPGYGFVLKYRGPFYLFVERPLYEFKRLVLTVGSYKIIKELLFVSGFLGVFTAWPSHRRWIIWNGVIVFSSLSYVLFGHMETRYYIFTLPLTALLAAHFLLWAGRRIAAVNMKWAVVFALAWGILFANQARPWIRHGIHRSNAARAFDDRMLRLSYWLKDKLGPGEGIMSYRGGEIGFIAGTLGACPPNVDLARWIKLADRYNLRYFMVERADNYVRLFRKPGSQYWLFRQLAPLFFGQEIYGFKLAYYESDKVFVYRIPKPDEIDLESLPKLPEPPEDFTKVLLTPERGGIQEEPPPLEFELKMRRLP